MKVKFDTLQIPSDSSTFYFLLKKSWQDPTNNSLDSFSNSWYSKMLFALKEPTLKNYQGDKEIYRFTWLRTFHHPVSVRLEKQNNIIRLFAKVCNGAGGYEPGNILSDTTINIETKDWTIFMHIIDKTHFWQLKTENIDETGNDGSEWIIEASKDNKYHMVSRWTPRQGNFREIGEYLVTLSRIRIDPDKFY